MFNLQAAPGWEALGAAWRVAASNMEAACDLCGERERAAQSESKTIGAPGDAADHAQMLERRALLDAIAARHGVPEAEKLQEAAGDLEFALKGEALSVRAPTLAAFMLKLDMVSDSMGSCDFDTETWPLFLADVRRFAFLKSIDSQRKGARQ